MIDAFITKCVLKLSDATTVPEHILLVKIKARTTNWHIYLRIKNIYIFKKVFKMYTYISKRNIQVSRKYNKV